MPNILTYTEITDTDDNDVVYVVRGTGSGSDKHQKKSNLLQEERTRLTTNEGNISTNTSNISTNTANIATNTSDIAAIEANAITGRLHIQDQKTTGTNGGTFTAGAWQTRVLNTVLTNTISGASLSSNQIILPAGTYEVEGSCPVLLTDRHSARLQNISDASTLLHGSSEYGSSADSVQTRSFFRGVFTLAASKTIEIQHRCQTTRATDGFGTATSFAAHETYTDIMIKKIG